MKLHLHAHCRTGPSSILPHAALLASSRGQLRAPCQPRSCLLCGATLVHPTPYASGFIPMRQAARAFPISTFYAVPLQSAPVSDNPPGVSLNLLYMCYYTLSILLPPASPPPAHRLCHRNVQHASPRTPPRFTPATPVRPRGAPLREPPPTPPRRLHTPTASARTRDGDRELLLGARVFAF